MKYNYLKASKIKVMSENLNQSDTVSDVNDVNNADNNGLLEPLAEGAEHTEQSADSVEGNMGESVDGSGEASGNSGENPDNSSEAGGGETSDNTDNGGGDAGDGSGGSGGDGVGGVTGASSARPLLQNVMSLCVSMIEGAVKDEDFAALMDAIVAREKILELERLLESERAAHEEELSRLKESMAEELERKTVEAYGAGEIAGRNARIEESLRAVPVVPALGGTPAASPRKVSSIFDLAASAR